MADYSVNILKPSALSPKQKSNWEEFHQQNAALYSPYFHIEYTLLLDEICPDVYVLVISNGDENIGFLPFQAKRKTNGKIGSARPIGAPMTDYHGVICAQKTREDVTFDLADCLRRANIDVFHFTACIAPMRGAHVHTRDEIPCTVLDIVDGVENWRTEQSSSYRRHLKSTRRRMRKAEELGARKFVFSCKDQTVFEQLITWKQQKFLETGKYDVLSVDWTQALLRQLWQRDGDASLRADMHALYFGDTLAAIDMGLTDGTTFHSWMVAYNNECQHLAPGIQLLEGLIDEARKLGYDRIDLGEGMDGYKRHYANIDIKVTSGFFALAGTRARLSKIYDGCENFGEHHFGGLGKLPGKLRRRYTQISACDLTLSGRTKAMLAALSSSP